MTQQWTVRVSRKSCPPSRAGVQPQVSPVSAPAGRRHLPVKAQRTVISSVPQEMPAAFDGSPNPAFCVGYS